MNHRQMLKSILVPFGLTLVLGASAARADTVVPVGPDGVIMPALSSTATGSGTQSPATILGNPGNASQGISVNDLTGNPASNYGFTDSFQAANGAYFAGTIQSQPYNFVDSYVIDIPNAFTSAYVFSLNLTEQLGIQNLSARLYAYSAGGFQNLTVGSTGPVNGGTAGPWSAESNANGVVSTQLLSTNVPSGEYVLQLVGLETGTQSGMYNGSLAVTPVPLPAALPLLLSGLGFLRIRGRRRDAFRRVPYCGG